MGFVECLESVLMVQESFFDDHAKPFLDEKKTKTKRTFRLVANRLDLTKNEKSVMIAFRGSLPLTDEELVLIVNNSAQQRNKRILSANTIIKHRKSLNMKGAIRNSGQIRPDSKGNQSIIWEAISE